MIGSPSFAKLINIAKQFTSLPPDPCPTIQKAVIGKPILDNVPLLHELISGPFDADKLDYMARDAVMCGVPVITDMSRLVRKVRAARISQAALPREVARNVKGGLPSYTLTGIAVSGGRTIDELILGRTLLSDKVYRHQKVRAIEAMIAVVVAELSDVIPDPVLFPFKVTDDEYLAITADKIERLSGRKLLKPEKFRVRRAIEILQQLKDRKLFVRCFAFAQNMPLDPYQFDDAQRTGMERLMRETLEPARRQNITELIYAEVDKLTGCLPQKDRPPGLTKDNYFIFIDPPKPSTQSGDISRAYLITGKQSVISFRSDYAESKGWADAYLLTRDIGYVFGPREYSPFIYLATEKLFRAEYGIRMPDSMLIYAKQDALVLTTLRQKLADRGYYANLALDLHPIPERLLKADIDPALQQFAEKFAGYQGLARDGDSLGKATLNPKRIRDWLRQFKTDRLIDSALQIVGEIKLINRLDVAAALRKFIALRPEFRGATLCPLGGPKDSSAVNTYYAADVRDDLGLQIASLEDAIWAKEPILFVDDFIGSGAQSISILERWLNIPLTKNLGEDRGKPLPEALRDRLARRRLGFCFVAGNSDGINTFQKRAKELTLDVAVQASLSDNDLPHAFGRGLINDTSRETEFRDACERIGFSLLLDPTRDHDETWARDRALGYGNQALLLVFPYNTPSQTLSCLWKAGNVDGMQWLPLFPRRPKR